ncbi:hypothetical protein PanWU01x14_312420 [Parasponia andersonii]|uniref:Uncharacterized protein n=1 Tax=Parasponia andersonii TaxID=3476 RepID=A0A2P5APH3_PARAD|nr:hypothetical protein PanWU01x14_312420 [Parasponia andersonii]
MVERHKHPLFAPFWSPSPSELLFSLFFFEWIIVEEEDEVSDDDDANYAAGNGNGASQQAPILVNLLLLLRLSLLTLWFFPCHSLFAFKLHTSKTIQNNSVPCSNFSELSDNIFVQSHKIDYKYF